MYIANVFSFSTMMNLGAHTCIHCMSTNTFLYTILNKLVLFLQWFRNVFKNGLLDVMKLEFWWDNFEISWNFMFVQLECCLLLSFEADHNFQKSPFSSCRNMHYDNDVHQMKHFQFHARSYRSMPSHDIHNGDSLCMNNSNVFLVHVVYYFSKNIWIHYESTLIFLALKLYKLVLRIL